jgi:hypothetical protein
MILKILSSFMVLVYLGLGIYLLILPPEAINFSPRSIKILGGMVLIYGGFRAFRVYQSFKK